MQICLSEQITSSSNATRVHFSTCSFGHCDQNSMPETTENRYSGIKMQIDNIKVMQHIVTLISLLCWSVKGKFNMNQYPGIPMRIQMPTDFMWSNPASSLLKSPEEYQHCKPYWLYMIAVCDSKTISRFQHSVLLNLREEIRCNMHRKRERATHTYTPISER